MNACGMARNFTGALYSVGIILSGEPAALLCRSANSRGYPPKIPPTPFIGDTTLPASSVRRASFRTMLEPARRTSARRKVKLGSSSSGVRLLLVPSLIHWLGKTLIYGQSEMAAVEFWILDRWKEVPTRTLGRWKTSLQFPIWWNRSRLSLL